MPAWGKSAGGLTDSQIERLVAYLATALATAILVVNNLRDRVGDTRAGKRTLAVRFGRGLNRHVLLRAHLPGWLILAYSCEWRKCC